MGNRYNSQGNPRKAQSYIQKAFEIKPGNTNVQLLLVQVIAQQSDAYMNDGNNLKLMYQNVNDLLEKYDVLSDNKQIINLMYKMALGMAGYYYYDNNAREGRIYKERFEAYYDSVGVNLDYETKFAVEKAYSTIAAYYFKRNNYREARKVVEKALVYFPDSYSLKRKLKALD
ncbi:MAG: tetratricopeptide repeat protein [Chlorobi bacterium]|nr:tetratricopeptide repeat protein [Chlorobiota bacterium]